MPFCLRRIERVRQAKNVGSLDLAIKKIEHLKMEHLLCEEGAFLSFEVFCEKLKRLFLCDEAAESLNYRIQKR